MAGAEAEAAAAQTVMPREPMPGAAAVDPGVDDTIEAARTAHGLTAINVRNILHHILANDTIKNFLERLERGEDPAIAKEAAAEQVAGGSLRRLRSTQAQGQAAHPQPDGHLRGRRRSGASPRERRARTPSANASTTEEEASEDEEYVPSDNDTKVRTRCPFLAAIGQHVVRQYHLPLR